MWSTSSDNPSSNCYWKVATIHLHVHTWMICFTTRFDRHFKRCENNNVFVKYFLFLFAYMHEEIYDEKKYD